MHIQTQEQTLTLLSLLLSMGFGLSRPAGRSGLILLGLPQVLATVPGVRKHPSDQSPLSVFDAVIGTVV